MDGQEVPKDQPFTLAGRDGGTYYPMYPRDPSLPPGESINCHCIVQPVVDRDRLGMSDSEIERLVQEASDLLEKDTSFISDLDAEAQVASDAWYAQNHTDLPPWVAALTPEHQKWYKQISGTVTTDGITTEPSQHLAAQRSETSDQPRAAQVIDALTHPVCVGKKNTVRSRTTGDTGPPLSIQTRA